jgi:uncharacterized membrane protein YkvA (DUF1232 family)
VFKVIFKELAMNDQPNPRRDIQPFNLGFVSGILRHLRLVWRLLFDPRVPLWLKMIVPASLVYVISPIDFMPDVIVGLGQLDDLAAIIVGTKLFVDLCPPHIVREHTEALMSEANWRVEPGAAQDSPSGPQIVDAPYEIKGDTSSKHEP